MSDAIDRAAVRDEVEYRLRTAAAHYRSCGKHDTDPGDFLDREIEAMTERLVGLLAPAPLREEWGTRFGGYVYTVSEHTISTTDWPWGKPGTLVQCSCGWRDFWSVMDGSAEASAEHHRVEMGEAPVRGIDVMPPGWKPYVRTEPREPDWECPDHPQHCSCHISPPCSACVDCETCIEHYAEEATR